jgi:hypothetical protein
MHARRSLRVPIALFLLVFAVDFFHGITTSYDSRFACHVAMSIWRRGTTDLDPYLEGRTLGPRDITVERVDGHARSYFPIGTPLVALPFVAAADVFLSHLLPFTIGQTTTTFDLDQYLKLGTPVGLERFIAAVVVAACTVVVFAIASHVTPRRRIGVLAALLFAFATPAWSTASRALWQHGPSMLALSATLLLLLKARGEPRWAAWAALPLAFSYVIRPTNSIAIVVLGLYVALVHRRELPRFLGFAALVAVPFVAYDESVYHALLPPYYRASRLGLHGEFLEALAANWISPSRGVLVFSPIFLFSIHGLVVARDNVLARAAALMIVLHSLAISTIFPWSQGACFGPRYFSDVTPWFVFLLVFSLDAIATRRSRALPVALLALATFASVFIHHRGATSYAVYDWNLVPGIDEHRERVWDTKDIQFLRRS